MAAAFASNKQSIYVNPVNSIRSVSVIVTGYQCLSLDEIISGRNRCWADRSGVDRYLGMVEAAGSIPARSIFVLRITVFMIPSLKLMIYLRI